jgi:hypothetical protein
MLGSGLFRTRASSAPSKIRELSGFDLTFQVRRLVLATLAKTRCRSASWR